LTLIVASHILWTNAKLILKENQEVLEFLHSENGMVLGSEVVKHIYLKELNSDYLRVWGDKLD